MSKAQRDILIVISVILLVGLLAIGFLVSHKIICRDLYDDPGMLARMPEVIGQKCISPLERFFEIRGYLITAAVVVVAMFATGIVAPRLSRLDKSEKPAAWYLLVTLTVTVAVIAILATVLTYYEIYRSYI